MRSFCIEMLSFPVFLAALLGMTGCDGGSDPAPIEVRSISFGDGDTMPERHTCAGAGISPPISFSAGPEGTESFALIMVQKDEDASAIPHWILWGIAPDERWIGEDVPAVESPKPGVSQGINYEQELGYHPPCAEDSLTHRYAFRVYALDNTPALEPGASAAALEAAMDGHVVGRGTLVGFYQAD